MLVVTVFARAVVYSLLTFDFHVLHPSLPPLLTCAPSSLFCIQCKRVNIGGKLLTNYLKESISYRQVNVMEEFRLVNEVRADQGTHSSRDSHEFPGCVGLD